MKEVDPKRDFFSLLFRGRVVESNNVLAIYTHAPVSHPPPGRVSYRGCEYSFYIHHAQARFDVTFLPLSALAQDLIKIIPIDTYATHSAKRKKRRKKTFSTRRPPCSLVGTSILRTNISNKPNKTHYTHWRPAVVLRALVPCHNSPSRGNL